MVNKKAFFQKLTPSDDIDIKGYEEAFEFIFANPDIKNIAISGPYSSGKSSVLASYKKENTELNFIHVSLAQYQSADPETNTKEPILEGKILNQLIHQIPSKNIPQTNFRIKKRVQKSTILGTTLLLVLFVFFLMYLIFFNSWSQYILSLPENWLKYFLVFFVGSYAPLVSVFFLFIFLTFFVINVVKIQKNKNIFRKITLQGNEIEIFEESEDSYFDKYLNEVLYLFENVEVDVIVFEDLDRFNVNKIFERLKEINILVNLHKEKKPLRFFYLLRDDIFISKDRTKFFDYIVPIVPVLDTSNSYDKLYSYLLKGGYQDNFDKTFLQGVSLYIDDMRILKNIYNEFVIYIKRINNIELDYNKMLAIIIYKNLFPKDFNDLQLNRGFMHSIFAKKETYIEKEIEELKIKISDIKIKIDSITEENIDSLDEFNIIYEHYKSKDYYNRPLPYDDKTEKMYQNRKQVIQDKIDNNTDKYKTEIINIEKKLLKIKNLPLSEIINRENIDDIFNVTSVNSIGTIKNFDNVKSSDYFYLLKYLVRNCYIDESYSDYMSYFYVGALSRADKIFLRSVTDKKRKDSSYKLDNVQQIINRLNIGSFSQEEILNYDVMHYLLINDNYHNFLETLMIQLKYTENFKFIESYLDIKKENSKFVFHLNKTWPEFLSAAINKKRLTEEEIYLYSLYSLYYSSNSSLEEMNKDRALTNYISNNSEYLSIEFPKIDRLIEGFLYLNVLFEDIDYEKSNKALFKVIYEESLYKINSNNLFMILTKIFEVSNKEDILHKNYTIINQLKETTLYYYVEKNIDLYVDVILDNCDNKITDEEDIVLMILKNKDISDQHKDTYINYLETKISSILDVEDEEIKKMLLNKRLVIYSERNILDYYIDNGLDSTLINFVNTDELQLDFSEFPEQYDDELALQFFYKVIFCNGLEDNKYKEILTTLGYQYEEMPDIESLDSNKFKILVETKIIPMTLSGLTFVRNNFSNQTIYYIKNNLEDYSSIMTNEIFVFTELIELLSSEVENELKIKLLNFAKEPISILGKEYPLEINQYILKNNLDKEDLPELFSTYYQWDSTIQEMLKKLADQNFEIILSIAEDIPKPLIISVFTSGKINEEDKYVLLIALISNTEELIIKEYVNVLNLTNYSKLFLPNKRPIFEVNSFNKKLLEEFTNKGIIKYFKEKPSDKNYYIVSLRS
ncbi:MAG: hypothetical protein WBA84_06505 [Carnobacterium sp.]|uniref:YobI family P-loop NTPase n=1 Tax=Carnobacterium sp. TaxID=48221 RepID=UPI003C771CC8